MECLGVDTFLVMPSVLLSGGMKIRDEHGMLRGVYISCHDFCQTFRWYENEEQGDRRQRTDDRGQTTDDRGQTTDDS